MYKYFVFVLGLVLVISSCKEEVNNVPKLNYQEIQDSLIPVNQKLNKAEDHLIDKFVERKQWKVTKSKTGLRFLIYHEGKGQNLAKAGQFATISYKISLLNGNLCYESKLGDNKEFLIEADEIESGIHEGIKYMKVGDKAKLIIPSYLAHGLLGDLNKIPPRSPIVYDVELLRLR